MSCSEENTCSGVLFKKTTDLYRRILSQMFFCWFLGAFTAHKIKFSITFLCVIVVERGQFANFGEKNLQVPLIIIREWNLDNFPPGAFYLTPLRLQLGTKEYEILQ